MIKILDRYIVNEVSGPFIIGVGMFTFFLVVDRIYHLTDLVITKSVPFHLVLSLLVLMLPSFLGLTLPMALLVAVLLVCGRLAGDLEVAALKAAGVSPLRLLRPFVGIGLLVTLLIGWLTIVVAPWSSGAFQRQLFKILQTRAATGIQERTFSASFGSIVIYVEEISTSQVALKGVFVSDERNPALSRIIVAREGRLLSDEASRRITLRFVDGSINETDVAEPQRFRHTAFSLYDMTLPVDSALGAVAKPDKPEKELPLPQLVATASQLQREGENAAPYWVELHKRFALPVAALVFVMVGFPLGIRAQRGGRGVALALSFGIVVCYYVLFTTLEDLGLSRRLPPAVAIWMPNLAFTLLGLGLLRAGTVGMPTAWTETYWRAVARLPTDRPRWLAGLLTARGNARARGPRGSSFIMDRYLLRQYVMFLGIGVLVAAVLVVVGDMFQTLDRFLRIKPPFIYIAQHFLYILPRELYKALPLIVLVGTIFLFLSLTRQRELDALKAAGVSLYRACAPILGLALCISAGAVIFQEFALPEITARMEEVDRVKIRGQLPRHLQKQGQIWYHQSDTRFVHIGLLDPAQQSLESLSILDIDRNFRLLDRFDARRAQWTPDGWRVWNGFVRRIDGSGLVTSEDFAYRVVDMPEHIDDLVQVQRRPDSMSFLELRAYVARLRERGHPVTSYIVELYSKLSFPVVHVIMALVAIPFALVSPRSGGRAVGISVAIVIGVGYWLVHSMALAFARADLLPPALAAWTANIVFLGLGSALLLNART